MKIEFVSNDNCIDSRYSKKNSEHCKRALGGRLVNMTPDKFSRRDFIKLVGAGAAFLTFGKLVDVGNLLKQQSALNKGIQSDSQNLLPSANAQTPDPWVFGPPVWATAIHAALLPTGKLLIVAGSGYHDTSVNGPYEAKIMDVHGNEEVAFTFPDDPWCCGQTNLGNGNILWAGGTLAYDIQNTAGVFQGAKLAYEFNVYTNKFEKLTDMSHGRWYPTCVVLPDGKVFVVSGLDEYGQRNALVEIYDPVTKTFTIQYDPGSGNTYCVGQGINLPGAGSPCYGAPGQGVSPWTSLYPRMHLMPSGLIASVGMQHYVHLINPTTGEWGASIGDTQISWRDYGTSFLLPLQNTTSERGKILIAGGSIDWQSPATAVCEMLDFNAGTNTAPVFRLTASLATGRRFPVPVILPTGECVLFGGAYGLADEYVRIPEMFNPVTETWTSLPAAKVSRTYHQSGLLLLDGRVWTASGQPNRAEWERRTEIFSPWYMFAGSRPTINGRVKPAPYGGTIRIPTSNGADITKVSLVRLPTYTHHYNPDMRLVWLQIISSDSTGITVSAPINNRIAPPGDYMIHIINSSGVPSEAKVVRVPGA